MPKAINIKLSEKFYLVLTGLVIIASVFHFWPLENNKMWQILNIPNLCCVIGLIIILIHLISDNGRSYVFSLFIPNICILSYLAINVFSISFADSALRPLNYVLKLLLVFCGGFFVFQKALSSPKSLKITYVFITIAVFISIIVCICTRLFYEQSQFGFHGNAFKYGTYIAILSPLCIIYLFSGSKYQSILGIFITLLAFFSIGSMGGILAIFASLIAGLFLIKRRFVRFNIVVCIILSIAVIFFSNKVFDQCIQKDFVLVEKDGTNLRQRYIEWQAEINLLAERGITGTGAGCINDYRSKFYYRLPKLNTLKAFDQNGFLAVAAETGLMGLITFCWIIFHFGRITFKDCQYLQSNSNSQAFRFAVANTASLISALVANIFSSVHYNGVLLIFVLLLCLILSLNKIYGECHVES